MAGNSADAREVHIFALLNNSSSQSTRPLLWHFIYFYAKRCSLSSNKQSQLGPKRQILRFSVTQGTNINNGEEVAIKLEDVSIVPFLLEGEAVTYRSLSGDIGILQVYAYETE